MIKPVSYQPVKPYQFFEPQTISTVQKIIVAAMAVITGLGITAISLVLPPIEGVLIAFALGGAVLMFAGIIFSPAPDYLEAAYRSERPFYSRWVDPIPVVHRFHGPQLFVNDPVYRASTAPTRPPSRMDGPRVKVGGGRVPERAFSAPPSWPRGNIEGERVRVGNRRLS